MSWLVVKAFLGGALSKAWGWLTHASFWQLTTLALGCLAVVQHFTLADARHDRDAWHRQFDAANAQLQAISSKRDEQKVITKERIEVVREKAKQADDKAKTVESEPLPGNCATPKGVLDADI